MRAPAPDLPTRVAIVEEGPREGFQFEAAIVPTADKVRLIEALAEERDRELVHLRLVRGPQGLDVRGRADLGEPGDVVRVDDLQMGQVVPAGRRTVLRACGLDGVEHVRELREAIGR